MSDHRTTLGTRRSPEGMALEYRAACTCGWESRWVSSTVTALQFGGDHEREEAGAYDRLADAPRRYLPIGRTYGRFRP